MNQPPASAEIRDFRPAVAVVVALFAGAVGGYFAHGAFEPQRATPHYKTLEFVPRGSLAAYPRAFASREEAIAWLQRQISFLDRNATDSQRPVVDRMKLDLAHLEQHAEERIERALLDYVREEAELLRGDLGNTSAPPAFAPGWGRARAID